MNKRSKSELCLKLAQENAQLMDKIGRSKPVLETIYDKVKRKQKLLYDKIFRNKKDLINYKNIANDYKHLYEHSLQMINNTKLLDRFDHQQTNYIKTKYKNPKEQNLKSKSVYQQYRERIDKGFANSREQKNPQIKALQRENQQLKNKMLEDIDKLRLVRKKSQRTLKKAHSSQIIKDYKQIKQGVDQEKIKKKLVERRKQLLTRIQ